MANPRNTPSSIKKEPELLEIVSEELNQQLQLEDDYVWVNLHEIQQQVASVDLSDSTPNTDSSVTQNVRNVVQSETSDIEICDEQVIEKIYYSEDSDINETDVEDEPDTVDYLEFKMDIKRPVNILKMVYPMPQWLKQKEHGTNRRYSSDKKISQINNFYLYMKSKNSKNVNSLLPEIKFDASTTAVLKRLIENRYLGQYNQVIGRGKHSVVFHAYCHRRVCIPMTSNNAVKVYKLSNKKENNESIFRRVEKEFEHLQIVQKHSHVHNTYITPIRAWENVLVMSYGFAGTIAPSIQDLPLQIHADTNMYFAIVSFMHKCYNTMRLVHGKLCARNIRCWFEHPHFISWGHSVKTDHPQALPKLIKDCKFVTEFYAKRGVKVKSTEDLFKEITGCLKISSKLLKLINNRDLYNIYNQNPNRRSSSPNRLNKNLRFKCK